MQIWNVETKRRITELNTTLDFGGDRLAISRDGRHCGVGAYHTHGVALYETKDGTEVWRRKDRKKVQCIRISKDDKSVLCGFSDKDFEILNLESGKSELTLQGVDDVFESVYDDVLVIDGKDRGDFILVDSEYKKIASVRRTTFAALDFAFAPQKICVTQSTGSIHCYDINSGNQQWVYKPGNGIHALTIAYNEQHQIFSAITWPYKSGGDHQLITLSPDEGDAMTIDTISNACEFAFCRKGSLLITSDGKLRDIASGDVHGILDFFPNK